jgi:hypothetical protein
MTVMVGIPSEQFGLEKSIDQVDEQPRGNEAGERIVEDHGGVSSKLVTGIDVGNRQREEEEP